MCQWPWEKKSRGMRSRTAMSLKLLGLSSEVRGEDSQYLYQSNAERKKYFKVKLPIDFFWEMCELVDKSIASKRTFWDFEGHCYSTFTSNFPPPRSFFSLWRTPITAKGFERALHWLFFFSTCARQASLVVTITPSTCPLLFIGGVFVQVDVGDTVDLSDLTSHQVEQSFAKHDLKCAGPRANAAVTLANPSCHLLEWPMRVDSCGVPKTNHCCVW